MLIRAIIEILGSPKEQVEKAIGIVVDKLKKDKELRVDRVEVVEAKKVKELWSSFCELEINLKLSKLLNFCFDYMPSSIEILEPDKLDLESMELGGFLNDLLARLHSYDMVVKNLKAENIIMKRDRGEM